MMASLLQVTLALGLVLGLIAAAAWLLQRLHQPRAGQGALIQLHASAALGARERVVLLEVAGQWLLVGVAAGQVNTLLQLPGPPTGLPDLPADAKTAASSWLNQYLNRHER
jgi:flagellar protein FliO/FliZ